MAFAGLRGTGEWGTDERPKNFREGILFRKPNGTAIVTALTSKAKKQSVDDPEFAWWEEELDNVRLQINDGTGYTATSTTFTVDSGGLLLRAGDILLVEQTETTTYDEEFVEVSSVTNDTTIVVKRGAANTTATGIADDNYLTRIGSANEEGSDLPGTGSRNPTKVLNYCQIFRTAYAATKTALSTKARTGDPYKMDKKRKMFDHFNKIEWAFLFGQAYEDTSGSYPKRFTKGLRAFITTNVKIYTTSPDEDDFLDTISPIFDWQAESEAGNERVVLAGNGFLNNINKVARNSASTRINFDGTLKIYGMELQRYVLPQGTLAIKTHPMMSSHSKFTNSAFFLDFSNIIYRPLRDTNYEDDVQTPGSDYREGVWTTETGLELHHERTMAYLGNFVV
jgi:Family of unknown function (DUF5309)